jgi:hypothetical protein
MPIGSVPAAFNQVLQQTGAALLSRERGSCARAAPAAEH